MDGARFRALDGLRGFAALLVVFYHMTVSSAFKALAVVTHGDLAVDLFFMLSGFVIASAYAGRIGDGRDMGRFLTLRFFRIYPLHLCVLLVFVAQELLKLYLWRKGVALNNGAPFSGDQSPGLLVATLLLVQAWGPFDRNFWNGPSWSISCEAFAYCLFAVTAPLRPLRHRLAPVAVLVFAVASYVYAATLHDGLAQAFYGPAAILRGVSGFLLGALMWEQVATPRGRALFAALGARTLSLLQFATVALVLVLLQLLDGPAIIIALAPLALLVPLLHVDRGLLAEWLTSRPMQFLGQISYSVYMVHFFILLTADTVLKRLLPPHPGAAGWPDLPLWPGTLVSLGLAVVVVAAAILTWRFVEEPGRAFGRRVVARRFPGAAGVAAMGPGPDWEGRLRADELASLEPLQRD